MAYNEEGTSAFSFTENRKIKTCNFDNWTYVCQNYTLQYNYIKKVIFGVIAHFEKQSTSERPMTNQYDC